MELPKILTETPNFDRVTLPEILAGTSKSGSGKLPKILTDTPSWGIPGRDVFDTDRDGVIDPWDCQPFNPDEDGLVGDIISGISGGGRTIVQQVSGGARNVTRNITRTIGGYVRPMVQRTQRTISRLPIHPSGRRAAARRAAVVRRVRGLGGMFSPEAQAGRRQKIKTGLTRVGKTARVQFDRAGGWDADIFTAPKEVFTGIAGMGASARQQIERNTAIPTAREQIGQHQGSIPTLPQGGVMQRALELPLAVHSRVAAAGRQQIAPTPKQTPTRMRAKSPGRYRRRSYADEFPEPDLSPPKL